LSDALGARSAPATSQRGASAAPSRVDVARGLIEALAMPATTPDEAARRDRAIAAARAAEREADSRAASGAISLMQRVDALLGLPAADPTLGVARR
jgi:hypothetical protein